MLVCAPVGCAPAERVADPAAWVGDHHLTVDELADLLVLAQPLRLEAGAAGSVAELWVEITAFMLADRPMLGEASFARTAMVVPARAAAVERWLHGISGATAALTAAEVENVFNEGQVRLLAHVLRSVDPDMPAEEAERQRRNAQEIVEFLRGGGAWADANQRSDDERAREDNGVLGLVREGDLPGRLGEVGFALQAGQISSVVRSDRGYHVLYRPTFDQVRRTFTRYLEAYRRAARDSTVTDSILDAIMVRERPAALERLRAIAVDPWGSWDRSDTLVTSDYGAVLASDAAGYVVLLGPEARDRLATRATDRPRVMREITRDILLHRLAQADGVEPDDRDWEGLLERHEGMIADLEARLGIEGDVEIDVTIAVDRYLQAVVSRQVEPYRVPRYLAVALLRQGHWSIDPDGVDEAVEVAARMLAATEEVP